MVKSGMILLSKKGFQKINYIQDTINIGNRNTEPVSQVAQQDDTFIVL